ncbi:MAG: class III poly(R)-hydroxyalkanoic acid synthase subunit PhaE [Gammaproteobacteria bacterium]|jgi:class III poly(R)-hydroxyalkanoic acid synthase PhaE subunit
MAESADGWARAWLDAQQQYLDAWLKLSRQDSAWPTAAAPFGGAGFNPWAESLQQWSKLFAQGLSRDNRDVNSRLFDLGKSYLGMGESFWRLLQQGNDATCAADWQELLQNALGQIGKGFPLSGGDTDPWPGFAGLWGLPLNTWQRMACSFSPFPGEMEKALRGTQGLQPGAASRAAGQYLSLPPVGYTREWQEQFQEWTRLYLEYTQAMQHFAQLLGRVLQRAIELFRGKMTTVIKEGESLGGLRAVYDLWIDCGEEAYAEMVATPEFPRLQAELVNALMRMKRHEQLMVEEVLTALNMPTRREMDTTHARVYELQRQLRGLRDALEDGEALTQLREELDEVRERLVARKTAPASRKSAKAPARKKTAAAGKRRTPAKRRAQPKTKKG